MRNQFCLTFRPALITLLACLSLGPHPECAGSACQKAVRAGSQAEETGLRSERLQVPFYLQWKGDKCRALWERPQLYSEALVTWLIGGGVQMQIQTSVLPDLYSQGLSQHWAL